MPGVGWERKTSNCDTWIVTTFRSRKNVRGTEPTPTSPFISTPVSPTVHLVYHLAIVCQSYLPLSGPESCPTIADASNDSQGEGWGDLRVGGVHKVVSVPLDIFLDLLDPHHHPESTVSRKRFALRVCNSFYAVKLYAVICSWKLIVFLLWKRYACRCNEFCDEK